MFEHQHPYPPFLFKGVEKLIVGTLPPPRFTTRELKQGDVDFCYGSRDGQLWPILDRIFGLGLKFETTNEAIEQRKTFLVDQKIGICDIVESAKREKIDASDLGMQSVRLRNLLKLLAQYPSIHTLLFTGGNSKNGPEYFFRKLIKEHGIRLKVVNDQVPRIHQFNLTVIPNPAEGLGNKSGLGISRSDQNGKRTIRTVSLTAPSGAANRAVGSLQEYKDLKKQNPRFNTMDFRVLQYQKFF